MTRTSFGIRACRLYERKSKRGNTYYSGNWGAVSVALVKSKFPSKEGAKYWELFLDGNDSINNLSAAPLPQFTAPEEARATPKREEDDEAPF